MKKRIIIFILLIISFSGYSQYSKNKKMVLQYDAYIRSGDGLRQVQMVPKGEIIQILEKVSSKLYVVEYNNIVGYVDYRKSFDFSGKKNKKSIKAHSTNKNGFSTQLPPILNISDISFSTDILEAEKSATLNLTIKNSGPGDAKDVYVNLSSNIEELEYPVKTNISTIKANGGSETLSIDISASLNLPTDEALFKIQIIEPNFKLKIPEKQLKFQTKEFLKPELIIAQYALLENNSAKPNKQIDINEMIDLKFAVQNIGQGNAENVHIEVKNNQKGVMLLGTVKGTQLIRENPNFKKIQTGKYETIIYRYFVNSEFTDSQLQFNIQAVERIGKFGFIETKSFPINKLLKETGYIRTIANTNDYDQNEVNVQDIPDFVVDVDANIPVTKTKLINTYALIIGNEDYQSKQNGLRIEQNVDFAVNDAIIFSQYCEKTLGVPNNQIKLLKNATAAEINRGLAWLTHLSQLDAGKAKLIFYYSGHGLPHEKTKEAYLIPVDVSGSDIEYGIKIADVYKKLTRNPARQITVLLDACFSGGARNQGLIAMKGIKVRPNKNIITGNMVVFSSSTGDESSAVYRAKQHGYFTYYLLKKLKDSKGETKYLDLSNYLVNTVSKEAGLYGKLQTPQVNVSLEVENDWQLWKFK